MDKFKITINYQTAEDADNYAYTELGETEVLVETVSDHNKALVAGKILADAHRTIVAQQAGSDLDVISALLDRVNKIQPVAARPEATQPESDRPRLDDRVYVGGDPLPRAADDPDKPDTEASDRADALEEELVRG